MIKLSIKLEDRNRFYAELFNGTETALVDSFILTDTPKDLLVAVMLLAEGIGGTNCRWQTDPGEYRWIFSCEKDRVILKILSFPDAFCGLGDDKGIQIFIGDDNRKRFCSHIKLHYDRLLFKHGLAKYKEIWGFDFPSAELERLNKALSSF